MASASAAPAGMRTAAIPRATYRVQLRREFGFADAAKIVPYLASLGVSHLYVSPILKARAGSTHGYDVVDFTSLNPELGARAQFDALSERLRAHGMAMIVDVVPNHMGVMGDDNAWWLDVLENGPTAEHASFFDIDWQAPRANMSNRLLVPVLGAAFGTVLEQGELRVEFAPQDAGFSVRYHEHRFPLDPREYPRIFAGREAALAQVLLDDTASRQDFESLLAAFARLPPRDCATDEARVERYRDKEVHRRRLARLCERAPALGAYIQDCVAHVNGRVGEPESFDALAALLDAQAYRLAYWRVAGDEINYRRFFDINTLAALRMDDPRVFDATHALLADLARTGAVDGLRIDHPDGLYDPARYFVRIQALFGAARGADDQLVDEKRTYVVAEKILATHERLPHWALHGTTGYEFGALLGAWLVDHDAESHATRTYESFVGAARNFEEIAVESKKLVMKSALAAEVAVLALQLDRIAQMDRHTADFTRFVLRDAIVDTIAHFPVYRTYVSEAGASDDDRRHIHWAINVARKRSQAPDASAFDFLRDVLLCELPPRATAAQREAVCEFALKFQQVTAPVMAKGVEDTALYRYFRLAALNEVGGEPRRFGVSTAALHQANAERAKHWPHAMLNTSTHDSKRDEDVRARLAVLSELHREWRKAVARWSRINRRRRSIVDDAPAPSRDDEYLIYQTLLGIWPAHLSTANPGAVPRADATAIADRVRTYIVKAAREAKAHTSWTNRNEAYEAACERFVERVLETKSANAFLRNFESLRAPVARFGFYNSLSQTLIKLTAPGMPDLYQGSERPAHRLVDPDNRGAVDFATLAALLDDLRTRAENPANRGQLVRELLAQWTDGRLKQYAVWRALATRAAHADLFADGEYLALKVMGQRADHVCAYMRVHGDAAVLVVATRWLSRVAADEAGNWQWGDTCIELPDAFVGGQWRDAFTDEVATARPVLEDREGSSGMALNPLLAALPIALRTWERP